VHLIVSEANTFVHVWVGTVSQQETEKVELTMKCGVNYRDAGTGRGVAEGGGIRGYVECKSWRVLVH
jgi:hypothetical protein